MPRALSVVIPLLAARDSHFGPAPPVYLKNHMSNDDKNWLASNWLLWLVVAVIVGAFAALIVYECNADARCTARGGVWAADLCFSKKALLP